jgi:hypothetical protein
MRALLDLKARPEFTAFVLRLNPTAAHATPTEKAPNDEINVVLKADMASSSHGGTCPCAAAVVF